MSFSELRRELLTLFSRGVSEPLGDDSFNHLALRVFRYQSETNAVYAGFLGRRGLDPESVARWEEVPFLPARAFKAVPLITEGAVAERVFRTSGTIFGPSQRGEHHVRDLSIYRASLLPNFRSYLLPEGGRPAILCLLPAPETAKDSSLSYMMGEVGENLGGEGALFFADSEGALQMGAFCKALDAAVEKGDPVLVAGTAFSFVRWGDWAKEEGWNVLLPPGSRIMETGGYKGRTRVVARAELYSALHGSLGVPADHIVNEYGMTELLSQFYEPVLTGEAGAGGEGGEGSASLKELAVRYHRGPPWVRTLVLDPLTLVPLPEGEVGILAHFDLANLGSVAAVLTEDLGRPVPGGFRLMGRSQGAEPRGCSLAMEEFMASISEES